MALPVLPNPDNFLGVALVINRSRDGPRFVFHYPPRLLPAEGSRRDPDAGNDVDEDDDILPGSFSRDKGPETGAASALHAAELAQWNHDDHLVTESGTQIVPWEHVAGFPTKDLENILTPARAYHKRLFQVSLDPIYCVSYPVYVPENGVWRKQKKNKTPQKQRQSQGEAGPAKREDEDGLPTDAGGSAKSGGEKSATEAEQIEARDTLKPLAKPAEEAEDKKSSMTMFNLVFFLNPRKHEVKSLVDIMFTHIIKKINKAYKYCQQRSDFVWKESKRILALKEKGREDKRKMSSLWEEILSTSSLAASMQDIYEAVSQNKIAALQLDTIEGMVTHSVQIPVPFHLPDLPQDGEEGQRGLWLTTANSLMGDEAAETPGFLDKNFALLLMMDEKRVIAELQSDPDETTLAMIEFVRHCKPTLSFYQVGQQSSNVLTPAQVRKFAQHFIFWRRAIAIPPLHARDMYIVSPNCDLRKLPQATAQWARQFPLSPALPNFLAELSVAPRPYKLHCPSKAHRPVYMAMLAWLMRGGWVTQLCTFAYVIVWPEIIYEVEYALEADEIARAKQVQNMGHEPSSVESDDAAVDSVTGVAALGDAAVAGFGSGFLPLLYDEAPSTASAFRDFSLSHSSSITRTPTRSESQLSTASTAINNPPPTPTSPSSFTPNNNNTVSSPEPPPSTLLLSLTPQPHQPTPAEQAAEKARLERIADKAARELAERATAHARKAPPQQTAHPSVNHARHLEGMTPHIILDAKKATGKESLYLSAIGRRLRDRANKNKDNSGMLSTEAKKDPSGVTSGGGGGGHNHHHHHHHHHLHHHPPPSHHLRVGGVQRGGGGASEKDAAAGSGDWDERVANTWPVFWKYFNGRSALERIALQEDMKRKDVWNLLTSMSEYLLCVRHW
ncbi:Nitrogen permease regulator 3 [Madurella fahalii]|uniref:Nitrogen permease regulator 3 n=1 Tax=Madurella fahalii TaxID=1157608 RepID=A0ABQ0G0H4_9PEZI